MKELNRETVAVITGASSGIGRATALALAGKGVRLSLLARSHDSLAEVSKLATEAGSADVHTSVCDVADEAMVQSAIRSTIEKYGRLDILINSAGLSLNGEVDGYALEDWRTVIETNLTGTFLTCREALPVMKRQSGGQIINISSGAGKNGIRNMAAYCASKFGVVGFSEALGLEVRGHNIRVSVLLPGSVATDFTRVANRQAQQPANSSPIDIGYSMTAGEVASVIVAMLEQPEQAWMSEVILRPLNLEMRRESKE
ncbi:MAG: SDR family oxidoreductase [Acidobacteria bacterium]|nr:SDR family oxidoreductase [Acidobacteriota bacterium]